jgi:hypothetical protein
LSVILRLLLMGKPGNSGGFVAVLKNGGNHKKPPATMQAVCLTVALEAATIFMLSRAVSSFSCLVKQAGSLAVLFFGLDIA